MVLRTFGTDLPDVAAAVTAWARRQAQQQYGDNDDWLRRRYEAMVLEPDALVRGRWARISTTTNKNGNDDER